MVFNLLIVLCKIDSSEIQKKCAGEGINKNIIGIFLCQVLHNGLI